MLIKLVQNQMRCHYLKIWTSGNWNICEQTFILKTCNPYNQSKCTIEEIHDLVSYNVLPNSSKWSARPSICLIIKCLIFCHYIGGWVIRQLPSDRLLTNPEETTSFGFCLTIEDKLKTILKSRVSLISTMATLPSQR